jgi:tight adherence protein C
MMQLFMGNAGLLIAAAALLFLAAVMLAVGVDAYLVSRRNMTRRLMMQGQPSPLIGDGNPSSRLMLEDDLLQRFASLLTPTDAGELASTRAWLMRAGYRQLAAVRIYNFAKPAAALAFAAAAFLVVNLIAYQLSAPIKLVIVLLFAAIGFVSPYMWVERNVQRRKEEAELSFPDMLDMLLICIEAGSGIDHACRRVSNNVEGISPVLSSELEVVNTELWAGKERAAVFRDFANRLAVPDISAFVTVLKQCDEFGVSIAESLRVYASDMRLKRITRAEEKANTMPVKVALGSILFTVPPTMVIMAGPPLYQIAKAFGGH